MTTSVQVAFGITAFAVLFLTLTWWSLHGRVDDVRGEMDDVLDRVDALEEAVANPPTQPAIEAVITEGPGTNPIRVASSRPHPDPLPPGSPVRSTEIVRRYLREHRNELGFPE